MFGQPLQERQVAVIDVAGCEHDRDQITLMIDDQMQLQAVEPPHRRFAALGDALERLVVVDAVVAADPRRCGIAKGNPLGGSGPAPAQVDQERRHVAAHQREYALEAKGFTKIIDGAK